MRLVYLLNMLSSLNKDIIVIIIIIIISSLSVSPSDRLDTDGMKLSLFSMTIATWNGLTTKETVAGFILTANNI